MPDYPVTCLSVLHNHISAFRDCKFFTADFISMYIESPFLKKKINSHDRDPERQPHQHHDTELNATNFEVLLFPTYNVLQSQWVSIMSSPLPEFTVNKSLNLSQFWDFTSKILEEELTKLVVFLSLDDVKRSVKVGMVFFLILIYCSRSSRRVEMMTLAVVEIKNLLKVVTMYILHVIPYHVMSNKLSLVY